ncbi:Phosphatidylinositol 4-kinase stt4 [Mucor circinelloides]
MNGLDYDLHSRILMSLAGVLADSRAKTTNEEVERLLSKCPDIPIMSIEDTSINAPGQQLSVGRMTYRYQQTLDALINYTTDASEERQMELTPRILSYLKHLPIYEWEEQMITAGSTLPDNVTYSLVSGLLEIAHQRSELREKIYSTLWNYGKCIINLMDDTQKEYIVYFILPSLAGLARALQVSPYLYKAYQLQALCEYMQPLIVDKTLENIRNAIDSCLRECDTEAYSRRVLASYWEAGIPLSSNRIIHDLLIILRNVTARVIAVSSPTNDQHEQISLKKLHLTTNIENAWSCLMIKVAEGVRPQDDQASDTDKKLNKNLRGIYVMSLGYFDDIKKYAVKRENEGKKWSLDSYMKEIMGTSLQVAALSSVYLHQVDDVLINYVYECLFKNPSGNDAWVHVASLDTAVLLAINFPGLNNKMTETICRYLATPSPVFELTTELDQETLTMQKFAIIRLAQCVQTKPSAQIRQAANSTFYALLNEITRYSEEDTLGKQPSLVHPNNVTSAPAVELLNESQKQQVCINALSAIVGVAVYLKDESIISQAYSVLSLRRKSFSISAIATLTSSLVDLALVSSLSVFRDIINLFSVLSRESLMVDNKQLTSAILNAQYDLAKKLSCKPEHYDCYLSNLLGLFVENGNTIQRMISKNKKESELPWISKLGKLLPVIRTLLEHDNFSPHLNPSEDTVSLFRNTWFHCILFGFVTETIWIREWHESMLFIAKKTPPLVIESATNYLESDLEYNSVLRGANTSDRDIGSMRQKLTALLPALAYDTKNFSFAQVVFALSVYHIEMMRSKAGDCSYILRYFMNDGVSNSTMSNCLETIADRVVSAYIKDASYKAAFQNLDSELRTQMTNLLKLCCHRLRKVHSLAVKISERIVTTFPQVFAEKSLITLLLELVQLLWLSCEAEYRDEYYPTFQFTSPRVGVTIELGDSFTYRKDICSHMYENGKKWLQISMDRAPMEINGLLQDYLAEYVRYDPGVPIDSAHLGRTLALEVGKAAAKNEMTVDFVPRVRGVQLDDSSDFVDGFTSRRYFIGEVSGIEYLAGMRHGADKLPDSNTGTGLSEQVPIVCKTLQALLDDVKQKRKVPVDRLRRTLLQAASFIVSLPNIHPDLITYIVRIPVHIFTPESLEIGTDVWNWVLVERADIEKRLMVEILNMWSWAQRYRKGLFSPKLNSKHPFVSRMTYTPSDRSIIDKNSRNMTRLFTPHITWIKFLTSRFYAIRHRSKHLINMLVRLLQDTFHNSHLMSTHSFARLPRFQLLFLGMKILHSAQMEALAEYRFRSLVYGSAFNWFSLPPKWHYGSRKSYALVEQKMLTDFYGVVINDTPRLTDLVTSSTSRNSSSKIASGLYMFLSDKTKDDILREQKLTKRLLLLLLDSELSRLSVWCNPLNAVGPGYPANYIGNTEKSFTTDDSWKEMVRFAWETSPKVAVQMAARFVQVAVQRELHTLIANNTLDVVDVPEALELLLGEKVQPNAKLDLRYLKYWAPVPAITAANYFMPAYGNHPLILQYAMRSLEYYPVDTVFFYVPQIVQALRYDEYGYVERYIMEAGQVSQLFAHQIIWNMSANFYVDADKECVKPDPLKPTLERIINNLVSSFTGSDRDFYEREFKFFGDVTAISGYLKEYIKYGQTEKKPMQKKRLDEELAKIKVDVGVYLPSNPDGHVVDINRTSGRPLQSHAKAPFMATFKIEKEKEQEEAIDDNDDESQKSVVTLWQSAIFKVGDDCRQDVLALQLIAVFKNIFTSIGMDLYVYPYRVVATAPGRGVIDVIPRSISRDQLGREKVNSMYDYFVAKYGGPNSIDFQRARTNFVQSVAAYSLISYLLQFKDRHNGNIMLDDDGHIIHIDFGFIFDIAPGGIGFESSPFKLTTEMVQVMGGNSEEQAFKQFSELVIKGYLACRPYAELIMQLVTLMLQSGLPCFKGETIKRMRTRFQADKSDRVAADFMIQRVKDSFENQRTVLYDYFQKVTNGIPY